MLIGSRELGPVKCWVNEGILEKHVLDVLCKIMGTSFRS